MITGCDSTDYKKAVSLYESGKYEEAIEMFEALGDYEDSAEMVVECNYGIALSFYNNGNYETAMNLFITLGDGTIGGHYH